VVRRDARGYRAQAISSSPPLGTGCLSAGLLIHYETLPRASFTKHQCPWQANLGLKSPAFGKVSSTFFYASVLSAIDKVFPDRYNPKK
jgi:hypothetical protein